jgi:hypothetical protein
MTEKELSSVLGGACDFEDGLGATGLGAGLGARGTFAGAALGGAFYVTDCLAFAPPQLAY